ncbi:MAG: hypothetical protein Q8Q54_02785 [Methylococcales bacterium]|nr:hypothetical protein [Methylococcales bacterium]MDP3837827.1 hypothetical protein [Methylococcales bacterium]
MINSQRDRLCSWTHAFEDNIRFCLYNGNTEEKVATPFQNETPLEYMLVRQVDAPILQKSQGQLRWIIIDEAHSYLGSQAAELSLFAACYTVSA